MKNVLQMVLIIIILTISGHVIVSNIEHIVYLNTKTYTFNFQTDSSINDIKDSIRNIEDNLTKINKLENSYLNDNELSEIKTYLTGSLLKVKSLEFLNYSSNKNVMTQKDLFKVISSIFEIDLLGNIDVYRTLAKYDTNLDIEQFVEYNYMLLANAAYVSEPVLNNYKYPNSNIYDENADLTAVNFMYYTKFKISSIEYVSQLVLESGDVNE